MIIKNGKIVTSIMKGGKIVEQIIKGTQVIYERNLFNIHNRTLGELTNDGASTAIRNFEFDKYYVGLTMNNYYYPWMITSYSITKEAITFEATNAGYGIAVPIKVKPNEQYIAYAEGKNTEMGFGFYTANGEYITNTGSPTNNVTIPENCAIMTVVLRTSEVNTPVTFTNVKVLRT